MIRGDRAVFSLWRIVVIHSDFEFLGVLSPSVPRLSARAMELGFLHGLHLSSPVGLSDWPRQWYPHIYLEKSFTALLGTVRPFSSRPFSSYANIENSCDLLRPEIQNSHLRASSACSSLHRQAYRHVALRASGEANRREGISVSFATLPPAITDRE